MVLSIPVTAVLAGTLSDGWFKLFDINGDKIIERTEYDQGIAKLEAFLTSATVDGLAIPDEKAGSFRYLLVDLSLAGFWKAFTSSAAMILATEIGDKTFFIAAVLSMKHDRSAVFAGAIAALVIMTILSTGMGLVLPQVLPRQYTHILGGILFLYFGIKLVAESRSMEEGKASDELEEVEEELLQQTNKKRYDEEEGTTAGSRTGTVSQPQNKFWYQIALQSLTLTFLAEWGDRSQIATIALAAAKNPVGVAVGGFLGHAFCTGLAVVGGRMLAARISEKTVSQWGGIVFLIFGLHSIFMES